MASYEGVDTATIMEYGTGAGNPIADILFVLAYAMIIKSLRKQLNSRGYVSSMPTCGAEAFFGWSNLGEVVAATAKILDTSYADDLAHVIGVAAGTVPIAIADVGRILWEVFTAGGFRLNWGPKKTACMVKWCGKDAAHCRALLEQEYDNKIKVMAGENVVDFCVVRDYKHMGTITCDTGSFGPEIKIRTCAVGRIARPLRVKVFQNPLISNVAKLNLMQSLLTCRQTFHAGCWPMLHAAEYQAFKAAIVRLYRMLWVAEDDEDADQQHWPSDSDICKRAGLLHPAVLLRYLRVCTAIRLAVRAPRTFWQHMFLARHVKRSWIDAVLCDLRWLQELGGAFAIFDTSSFVDLMVLAQNPLAAMRCLQKDCMTDKAVEAGLRALPILPPKRAAVALVLAVPVVVPVQDCPTVHCCDECVYTCESSKQLAAHKRIKHFHRHPVNKCIDTPWCSVCGILTHHRAGLMRHVQDSSRICQFNLLMRGECVSDEAAAALEAEAASCRLQNIHAGRGKHHVKQAAVRVYGPWQPVMSLEGALLASAQGHPLGNNQKWYRPARLQVKSCKSFDSWIRGRHRCKCKLCTVLPAAIACPASLYVQCTTECMICGARGLSSSAPFPAAD